MVRQLKFHEQKLLKKVDFLEWKSENNIQENKILRKYHIENREEYMKYNKICGQVKKLCARLAKLDPRDPFRIEHTRLLVDKMYKLGVLPMEKNSNLDTIEGKMTVSALCRRRLPVVMQRIKMAETIREAVVLIEQGHVRIGPDMIHDPAFLVSRNMEDFITWVDTSKIKRHIMKYNDTLDDYELIE
eukprot:Sdes_comp18507_c0_seq1m8540